jgi:hypothetical protein
LSFVSSPRVPRLARTLVFISYRFGDSSYAAARLARDLASIFGKARIFFDHESMQGGQEFRTHISQALRRSRVVLVLIGPRWLQDHDDTYRRRIDNPNDYVYQEVLGGLQAHDDAYVVPVLLQNVGQLQPKDLPDALVRLASLLSVNLETHTWEENVGKIAAIIQKAGVLPSSSSSRGPDPAGASDIRELAPPAPNPRRAPRPLLPLLVLLAGICLANYAFVAQAERAHEQARQALTLREYESLRQIVEPVKGAIEEIIGRTRRAELDDPPPRAGEWPRPWTSIPREESRMLAELAQELRESAAGKSTSSADARSTHDSAEQLSFRAKVLDQRIRGLLEELEDEKKLWANEVEEAGRARPTAGQAGFPPLPSANEAVAAKRLASEAMENIRENEERQKQVGAAIESLETTLAVAEDVHTGGSRRANPDVAIRWSRLADELTNLAKLVATDLDWRAAERDIKLLIKRARFDSRPPQERVASPLPPEKLDGYFFLYTSETDFKRCLAHGADARRDNQLYGNLLPHEQNIIDHLSNAALLDSRATEEHVWVYPFDQPSTGSKASKVAYAIALRDERLNKNYRQWWIGTGSYETHVPLGRVGWLAWWPSGLGMVLLVMAPMIVLRLERRAGARAPAVSSGQRDATEHPPVAAGEEPSRNRGRGRRA